MKLKDILTPSFWKPREAFSIVEQSRSDDSDFCREVVARGILSEEQMAHAAERYRLGRSKSGRCIFWMIDEQGIVRDGRIGDSWVSVMLKAREPRLLRIWHPEHCLFGLHLLGHTDLTERRGQGHTDLTDLTDLAAHRDSSDKKNICGISEICVTDKNKCCVTKKTICGISEICVTDKNKCCVTKKTICVVENGRSAVILSALFPEQLWLATMYPANFTVDLLRPLQGQRVVLFPHTDLTAENYTCWLEIADMARRTFHLDITVDDYLEQHATDEQKAAEIDIAEMITSNSNRKYAT